MFNVKFAVGLLSLSCLTLLPISLAARPAPAPVNLIKVYKYRGSLQCQGGGESLAQMRRQLIKQGVKVAVGQCGVDGLVYPAVCGASDGRINIFTIQRQGLSKAQAQGFELLRNLPDAQVTHCKPAS